ncbi:YIP1 family protein [Lentibacter algarum]|uniref:YIP1 family protein n=1 Tax=Lentibacter algarum TaxID=576131 RepID=UPI001C0689EE|nr:YIP1 family protein [Lentibacter algarum]MBU2982321.1 YIP1 family protein [Lentibacter algarum]
MSVVMDILATYKGPAKVMRKLTSIGQRDDRAIALLLAGCVILFVSQWPPMARQAHVNNEELEPLLGAALFNSMIIMPLVLYALALLVHFGFRVFGSQGKAWGQRLALFWAMLAASPLLLLFGLMRGFLGEGWPKTLIGALWLLAFTCFWFVGSYTAAKETAGNAQ